MTQECSHTHIHTKSSHHCFQVSKEKLLLSLKFKQKSSPVTSIVACNYKSSLMSKDFIQNESEHLMSEPRAMSSESVKRTNRVAQIASDELIQSSLSWCSIGSGRKTLTGLLTLDDLVTIHG